MNDFGLKDKYLTCLEINDIIKEDLDYIINGNLPWEKLKDKTILISGANGLLATYIVYTLMYLNDNKNLNCKIIGVVRNKDKAIKRFKNNINRNDIKIIVSDICKLELQDEKIDFIIHAASQASPIFYRTDPVGTINANVLGTNNLLEIALDNCVEGFLYISSGEVYGDVDIGDDGIKEENYGYIDPTNVRSCYAESKRIGETMCVSWLKQYDVPCKIVRPFHTYGPGISFDDGRVFSDFVANIVNGNDIIIKSDGSAKRCFCYIADAIVGFFTVLLNGQPGEAYNVANDEGEISIKDLAYLLADLSSEKKVKVIIDENKKDENYFKSEIKSSKPNISKIKKLGWKPGFSIKEGFLRTIKSYK